MNNSRKPTSQSDDAPTWTYVVGDIHGCYQEWLALEARILRHASRHAVEPFIVSVGDLIDRGPASAHVVRHFMHGTKKGTHAVVLGNHELLMLEALEIFAPWNFQQRGCMYPAWFLTYQHYYAQKRGMSRFLAWNDYTIMNKSMWLGQGGFSTLQSFGCDPHEPLTWNISAQVLRFLLKLPYYWEHPIAVVTHALAYPQDLAVVRKLSPAMQRHRPLSDKNAERLQQASHSLVWNRQTPTQRPSPQHLHLSGHTPLKRIRRFKKQAAIQLDTGCVYGGRLSAYCIEQDKVLSVPAQKAYF